MTDHLSMPHASATEAARLIWAHWQTGQVLSALPEACCPMTSSEGYAAQAQLPVVSGRKVLGWKIAATSANGQAHINVSGPMAGRLLSGQVFESGVTVPSAGNRMRVAEPEFAFAMAQDLPPKAAPYTQEQVMAAVARLHPALEVPDSRMEPFTAAGEAQLLADNACARHFVLGPAAPDVWRDLDLSTYPVQAQVQHGKQLKYTRDGSGGNVLGDPRIALTWLANQLSSLGITLEKGHVVTTGTCMVPLELLPGDSASADFGPLGHVKMIFSEV
ncbi:fumarylacetoacetate hydrolase family protein [Limnohabitans sp.]|uniref:2-keto-4-pentenoate hydratase n=1 Tax=Limnohabitans sp. TaxID=1907725 RepID=UPI0033411AA3